MAKRHTGYDIMAIGAHPDDVEHCIGGALLKWAKAGLRIIIVHMTSGEMGTHGSKDLRRKEARACAKALGCDVEFLDFKDTEIHFTPQSRNKLIRVIRKHRPKVVLSQYHEFPGMHPDHEQTGLIVKNAFRPSRFKSIKTPPHEPHWIGNIFWYLFPTHLKPSFVVDVSDVHGEWMEAAECYESQLHKIPGYYERIMRFKREHGALIDTSLGEGFLCDRPLNATELDILKF